MKRVPTLGRTAQQMSGDEQRRLDQQAEDVRTMVFQMLDAEPNFDGQSAGQVAAAVEQAFRQAMARVMG